MSHTIREARVKVTPTPKVGVTKHFFGDCGLDERDVYVIRPIFIFLL